MKTQCYREYFYKRALMKITACMARGDTHVETFSVQLQMFEIKIK